MRFLSARLVFRDSQDPESSRKDAKSQAHNPNRTEAAEASFVVAQVSQPAVSPISKSAALIDSNGARFSETLADLEVGETAGEDACATTAFHASWMHPGGTSRVDSSVASN
jgi:hypothetical protein